MIVVVVEIVEVEKFEPRAATSRGQIVIQPVYRRLLKYASNVTALPSTFFSMSQSRSSSPSFSIR